MKEDFLPLNGTDFVEFYVGNAKQAAYYYQTAFGFQPLAYRGLETGDREKTSYVLRQGKVTFVFTTALIPDSEIAEHCKKHGDGVKFVALWVDDATKSFEETTKRGGKPFMEPKKLTDKNGEAVISGIHTYGETVHLFVERKNYNGIFLPGFKAWNPGYKTEEIGFKYVDHMVGNVDWGQMNTWAKFYQEVMGFDQLISFDDKDISTEYSALMSKVMSNSNMRIKFPINEPAEGKKKSQIEEYIDFYRGAGVQHVALATDNIIYTVAELRRRGVEFLHVPEIYYDTVHKRVGEIDEDMEKLKSLNILIDRDEEGYLLQIFTKPVEDRPTVFYEIIQRKGARSFGKGNFKALFESIEREQESRGTL
ncbi:MAG: 4-hydroxyphenylpyruvate dioxygenase [Bacteroidales bacterium]|nr:4-hydroxyphenylpyruvate dioxygenase [Bacteroidales bacterium]